MDVAISVYCLLPIFCPNCNKDIQHRKDLWILFPQSPDSISHVLLPNQIVELVEFYGNSFYIGRDFREIHIVLEREVGFLQRYHKI